MKFEEEVDSCEEEVPPECATPPNFAPEDVLHHTRINYTRPRSVGVGAGARKAGPPPEKNLKVKEPLVTKTPEMLERSKKNHSAAWTLRRLSILWLGALGMAPYEEKLLRSCFCLGSS